MHNLYDRLVNVPLIVIGGTEAVWLRWIADYGWLTTQIVIPTLTVILLVHQIRRARRLK